MQAHCMCGRERMTYCILQGLSLHICYYAMDSHYTHVAACYQINKLCHTQAETQKYLAQSLSVYTFNGYSVHCSLAGTNM